MECIMIEMPPRDIRWRGKWDRRAEVRVHYKLDRKIHVKNHSFFTLAFFLNLDFFLAVQKCREIYII